MAKTIKDHKKKILEAFAKALDECADIEQGLLDDGDLVTAEHLDVKLMFRMARSGAYLYINANPKVSLKDSLLSTLM